MFLFYILLSLILYIIIYLFIYLFLIGYVVIDNFFDVKKCIDFKNEIDRAGTQNRLFPNATHLVFNQISPNGSVTKSMRLIFLRV